MFLNNPLGVTAEPIRNEKIGLFERSVMEQVEIEFVDKDIHRRPAEENSSIGGRMYKINRILD